MRKTHFKIAHIDGNTEVPIRGLFKQNGRLWVIHYIIGTEKYRCSDYLSGMAINNADYWHYNKCKNAARSIIESNKDFDFSKLPIINQP